MLQSPIVPNFLDLLEGRSLKYYHLFFPFHIFMVNQELKQFFYRAVESPLMSCISGCAILWISFGIRQTFGIYLIPVTQETGWDRSTFSIAAALMQLLWGFSQPF